MGALSEEQKKIVIKFAQQTQEAAEKIREEEEKRVRKIQFENSRKEEENYRKDEENWLANNSVNRMRRVKAGVVPPSGGTPVKQHLVVPQLEGRTTKSSIQEARGSYRTEINIDTSEEEEV